MRNEGTLQTIYTFAQRCTHWSNNRGIKLYNEGILEISLLPKANQFIPDLINNLFVINLFLLPAFERVDVEHFATVPFRELAV